MARLIVVRGEQALQELAQPSLLLKWRKLQSLTPWATAFQAEAFVMTWYEHYRALFEPLVALRYAGTEDDLSGLMTLAWNRQDRSITHAGAHQAEYHSWLAIPHEDDFLAEVVEVLDDILPWRLLRLKYVPEGVRIDRLLPASLRQRSEIIEHHRPLMTAAPDALKRMLAKSGNKSRFKRLSRTGELALEILQNPRGIEGFLEAIVTDYDLRQGAMAGSSPFRKDTAKRGFLEALIRHPDHPVHACVLRAGTTFLAGHIGTRSNSEIHLGLVAHSPFFAKDSPGKFLLAMLSEALAAEGYGALDLTPGGDSWKERFATHHDKVYELIVYRRPLQRRQRHARELVTHVTKQLLARVGIGPNDVRRVVTSASRFRPVALLPKLKSRIWQETEFRVYRLARQEILRSSSRQLTLHSNRLSDLLCFVPSERWQSRSAFLSAALLRLEQGEQVYTYVENGLLLHSGWLIRNQHSGRCSEVDDVLIYPDHSAVLYDFYTHPSARGRGLYQACIDQMLADISSDTGVAYAYISALADNRPSRHVIEKLGFHYQGSLWRTRRPFSTRKRRSPSLSPDAWLPRSAGAGGA